MNGRGAIVLNNGVEYQGMRVVRNMYVQYRYVLYPPYIPVAEIGVSYIRMQPQGSRGICLELIYAPSCGAYNRGPVYILGCRKRPLCKLESGGF